MTVGSGVGVTVDVGIGDGVGDGVGVSVGVGDGVMVAGWVGVAVTGGAGVSFRRPVAPPEAFGLPGLIGEAAKRIKHDITVAIIFVFLLHFWYFHAKNMPTGAKIRRKSIAAHVF